MTQSDELVTLGGLRTTTKIATQDSGAADTTAAVPSQDRADVQNYGVLKKDANNFNSTSGSSASWSVTSVEAVNKALKLTSVSSVMNNSGTINVTVPDNGVWFIDNGGGSTASVSNVNVVVATASGASSVSIAAGQVAGVMAAGGSIMRITGDAAAT